MNQRSRIVCLNVLQLLLAGIFIPPASAQDYAAPDQVEVLPVYFVPKGEKPPTANVKRLLNRHLAWSQKRYRELLNGESTFVLSDSEQIVYQSVTSMAELRQEKEGGAPRVAKELLKKFKTNRHGCPYIFVVVIMNPRDRYPIAGARPFNGGLNTGGGIVQFSSFELTNSPNFQSTLQHELGHAFGLPHVNVYGYDMKRNESLMSYNPSHHTRGFQASRTPGRLIDEDYRALAMNDRVFSRLDYKSARRLKSIVTLGPMTIPGDESLVKISTDSGETFSSSVQNVVSGTIGDSVDSGKVNFNPKTMWQSGKSNTGWVQVDIEFPDELELDRIKIYSQHSGKHHPAEAVRIFRESNGKRIPVHAAPLKSQADSVKFKAATAKKWRFEFRAGSSKSVVIRGLRFFIKGKEYFPPRLPMNDDF